MPSSRDWRQLPPQVTPLAPGTKGWGVSREEGKGQGMPAQAPGFINSLLRPVVESPHTEARLLWPQYSLVIINLKTFLTTGAYEYVFDLL